MSDVRYALRVLLKSPGFTLVVVLVLGLGIGATTAIFSVVDQALLRPLPFPDADRLYFLIETDKDRRNVPSSPESYSFLAEQNRAFEALGGIWGRLVTLTGIPEPQQLAAQLFSPNMFQVLGVPPILGRTFLPEEDRPGAEPVAVLGEKPWRELFGSDPDIVGKLITLDGRGYRVVGVMPGGFHGPRLGEIYVVWLPLSQRGENARSSYINLYGRLRPGISETEARTQMEVIAGRLGHGIHLTPLREQFVGDRRPELLLMLGAVTLVLLIGCANVANLLLARAAARAREMVVRAAIGASRLRLIRQSLTESLLLAIAGGAAGLLLAVWVLRPLLAANLDLPQLRSVVLDLRLLAFAWSVSLLTTVLCGLLPALEAARVDLQRGLKEGSGQASPGRRSNRARGALIVAEVALSLTLLAGAATMIQSFLRIRPTNPGFEVENRLVLTISLSPRRYSQPEQQADFVRRLKERLASVPGVRGVAATSTLPLSGMAGRLSVLPEDKSGRAVDSFYETVSEEYFPVMGIPLRQGRAFNRADRAGAPAVAIVNEAFVQRFFGGRSPVGRTIVFRFREENDSVCTIVGIAADTKLFIEVPKPRPLVFLPFEQAPSWRLEMILATAMPPMALLPAARRALRDVDPDQAIADTHTMQQVVNTLMPQVNFRTILMSAMAAVALLLAAIGIYAVIAFGVAQRTREIGIRVALGAGRGDVLRLVAWQGMLQLAIGIALGSLGAWAGVRLLVKGFYNVFPIGPGVFAIVAATLALVAIAASLLPARRALKVDPIQALRYE